MKRLLLLSLAVGCLLPAPRVLAWVEYVDPSIGGVGLGISI
jgi:hypothetical protein